MSGTRIALKPARILLRPSNYYPWTDDLRRDVAKRWLAGQSGTEIAKALSTSTHRLTREAIMGVLHRAGVYRSAPGPVKRRPKLRLVAQPMQRRKREGAYA